MRKDPFFAYNLVITSKFYYEGRSSYPTQAIPADRPVFSFLPLYKILWEKSPRYWSIVNSRVKLSEVNTGRTSV